MKVNVINPHKILFLAQVTLNKEIEDEIKSIFNWLEKKGILKLFVYPKQVEEFSMIIKDLMPNYDTHNIEKPEHSMWICFCRFWGSEVFLKHGRASTEEMVLKLLKNCFEEAYGISLTHAILEAAYILYAYELLNAIDEYCKLPDVDEYKIYELRALARRAVPRGYVYPQNLTREWISEYKDFLSEIDLNKILTLNFENEAFERATKSQHVSFSEDKKKEILVSAKEFTRCRLLRETIDFLEDYGTYTAQDVNVYFTELVEENPFYIIAIYYATLHKSVFMEKQNNLQN